MNATPGTKERRDRGTKGAPPRAAGFSPRDLASAAKTRPAFSLIELMIGIVILGLGMIMVATMFPVGWDRARELSEFTTHNNLVENAQATVTALTRVPGPLKNLADDNIASFAGDVIFDAPAPMNVRIPPPANYWGPRPEANWVHALNMENLLVAPAPDPRQFVPERPFAIERYAVEMPNRLAPRSFEAAQIPFHLRLYPTLEPRDDVDINGELGDGLTAAQIINIARWEDELDTRRYAWALLHRLHGTVPRVDPVDPTTATPAEMAAFAAATAAVEGAAASARSFDFYFVTLRRPQPTMRYAQQNPDPANTPNPYDFEANLAAPVIPAALGHVSDVALPVAWRVQVELPDTLAFRDPTKGPPFATGIPTEIDVPPNGLPPVDPMYATWVEMFPRGAKFIDEANGQVYTVVNRRLTTAAGDHAVLTLDREIVIEDIDLDGNDPRCSMATCAADVADAPELLRTVWVFPPPIEPGKRDDGDPITFSGKHPVVDITVRTVAIAPVR